MNTKQSDKLSVSLRENQNCFVTAGSCKSHRLKLSLANRAIRNRPHTPKFIWGASSKEANKRPDNNFSNL